MYKVETIKVVSDNEQGFVIINKSDKTPEQTLFNVFNSMKKPELLTYIKENGIKLPRTITRIDAIKTFLNGLDK